MSAREPAAPGALEAVPRCDAEGHCITCSDEGVPMRVLSAVGEGLARCVDAEGRGCEVLTGLVGEVGAGEWLLVHAGTALLRLDANPGSRA
jgi:hydrogenase maturation factor